ncbi:competence protein ComFC [Alkalibacillus flavidus]|uniref:Competence protein ComFC n=2 Tax=Alkalibacillus flavidus TaxID=546021 RepID=A0ABV2KTU3_9BACI
MKPLDTPVLCQDCQTWTAHFKEDPLTRNISLYRYTPFTQDIINRFKYRGDYEIINAFQPAIQSAYQTHFQPKPRRTLKLKSHQRQPQSPTIIPIPLHPDRQQDRLFNQAEAIARQINQPINTTILTRHDNTKQSKKSRHERLASHNPFTLNESPPDHILLIDDLYTTGTTLRQAAAFLKQYGAKSVESFTLIRS